MRNEQDSVLVGRGCKKLKRKRTIRSSIQRYGRISPRSTQGMTDGGRLEGETGKGERDAGRSSLEVQVYATLLATPLLTS